MPQLSELRSRLPLKAIIPILLISTLCIVSFATSAGIEPATTYRAMNGATVVITGDFDVSPIGFSLASSPIAESSAWSTTTPLSPLGGVPAGHWMYTVEITANNAVSSATVTVSWSTAGADYTPMGEVDITGTITTGAPATFVFDAGTSFDSPVAIMITVS